MSIKRYLPARYQKSPETLEYSQITGVVLDGLLDQKDELFAQFSIDTATWGLALWEQEYGLPTDLSKPFDYRRSCLRARMRGQGTTTVGMLKNLAESFTNGEVEVQELKGQYRIIFWVISAMGIPPNILDLHEAIREMIPAHIQFAFSYTYDTHLMLQQFTHKQLGMMTHGQVRRDTPHLKLQQYTHKQLCLMKHR